MLQNLLRKEFSTPKRRFRLCRHLSNFLIPDHRSIIWSNLQCRAVNVAVKAYLQYFTTKSSLLFYAVRIESLALWGIVLTDISSITWRVRQNATNSITSWLSIVQLMLISKVPKRLIFHGVHRIYGILQHCKWRNSFFWLINIAGTDSDIEYIFFILCFHLRSLGRQFITSSCRPILWP